MFNWKILVFWGWLGFVSHNAWEALCSCVQSEPLFLLLLLSYLLRRSIGQYQSNKEVCNLIYLYHSSQHSETLSNVPSHWLRVII